MQEMVIISAGTPTDAKASLHPCPAVGDRLAEWPALSIASLDAKIRR